jgi:hypothetical protein
MRMAPGASIAGGAVVGKGGVVRGLGYEVR